MSLLDLQRSVAASIMAPRVPRSAEAGAFIKRNDRLTSLERLEIYRRSYWQRVLDSLTDDFPGLGAVLGPRAFARLAQAYLSDSPSQSFTMRDLGSRLGEWLRDHPGFCGSNLALAQDMVRLEWAHIEAFDAAAKEPLGPEDLADLDIDMTVGLQAHIRLLQLRYPVDDLRIRAQEAVNEPTALRRLIRQSRGLQPKPIYLAVHRVDFTVFYRRLAAEEYLVLDALLHGASIGRAVYCVSAVDQIESWFAAWSHMGWLCQRGEE
jgi:hypothetical protein